MLTTAWTGASSPAAARPRVTAPLIWAPDLLPVAYARTVIVNPNVSATVWTKGTGRAAWASSPWKSGASVLRLNDDAVPVAAPVQVKTKIA